MIKKIYGFYRPEYIADLYLDRTTSLNGRYPLNFWIKGQYNDYISSGIISIKDEEIYLNRYVKEIAPGIKDLREFVTYEYNLDYVDEPLMLRIIGKIGQRFDLEILDVEQAKTFIRKQTDLKEVEEGVFEISPETTGMNGEIIPAKYLTIN